MVEDYFFETENIKDERVFVLIIYDIVNNKTRNALAKYLQGYGFRVQKSAFEALIRVDIYNRMLKGLEKFVTKDDNIRVYKIIGKGHVINYGKKISEAEDEIIVI